MVVPAIDVTEADDQYVISAEILLRMRIAILDEWNRRTHAARTSELDTRRALEAQGFSKPERSALFQSVNRVNFSHPAHLPRSSLRFLSHAGQKFVVACSPNYPHNKALGHLERFSNHRDENALGVPMTIVRTLLSTSMVLAALLSHPTLAGGNDIRFESIAADGDAGIEYRRVRSERDALFDVLKTQGVISFADFPLTPHKSRGLPGVALFDFDRDNDLDIYVTNGPGAANSLFRNQLRETGSLRFVDVASAAGVGVEQDDNHGVCFGDLDNDGDHELLVLSNEAPHHLFENRGDGTFLDISTASGITSLSGAVGCAMGDINGDGLLDITIANSFVQDSFVPIIVEPFAANIPNQLFLNLGHNTFVDVSESSGIRVLAGIPPGAAGITWATAMVDYDLDGDVDILQADDQAAVPSAENGGVDRGYLHVLQNDGSGHFTDVTQRVGTDKTGQWMGLSFGDFNCDGHMDFFATNFGDYLTPVLQQPYRLGESTSRWFLGEPGGTFSDPGVGALRATPFGWGTSAFDYDNDGDADINFFGGIEPVVAVDASNPGVILQNRDCSASFTYDAGALATSADHLRRNDQGSAVGDLNNDGFVDIVTVSNFDIPESLPLVPSPAAYGSVFDPSGLFVPTWTPINPVPEFQWNGFAFPDGTLSLELNSADNGNGWVAVEVMGSLGITSDGRVNRDGIGAVVSFTPRRGKPSMKPILGGSSYASQDSLRASFGLREARRGVVEILWPGGVRNRLYDVRAGQRITFPEIPCGFDAYERFPEYWRCVRKGLNELASAGVLSPREKGRFLVSSLRAFFDRRG